MGTSGNRIGYKVFSINTTVRNPQRNIEFLKCFKNFNALIFNDEVKILYFIELLKNGIYHFRNMSDSIKNKLLNDETLLEEEIQELLENNPQATGFNGRVMTQLRALKDQGFLIFTGVRKNPKIIMTNLAFTLIEREYSITDIYSKIMIGLHAYNPMRDSILNQSRVFLNTLFVISLLKNKWLSLGHKECKGILKYEFKSFVLGMRDCNYKQCVEEILLYRQKFGLKENKSYIENYLFNKQGLMSVSYNTLNDYADEVFRKFEMTGLLISRGKFGHIYYDFSIFNMEKVESILNFYKDYKFLQFDNVDSYINFLDNIKLPWIENQEVRKSVILQKAKSLELEIEIPKDSNLDLLERSLDSKFNLKALSNTIGQSDLNLLLRELEILTKNQNTESIFKELPEPLRLEYILALVLGKKYGTNHLISNLIYSENGTPLSYAPAGKVDLEYKNFLIEATMIKNKNQQLNSETTSIARHLKEKKEKSNKDFRVILIAPYIHWDVALFFKFCTKEFEIKLAPISITTFIEIIKDSETFQDFQDNFDKCVLKLINLKTEHYIDRVNY